jgi:pimeloyl-ACP methyl ester carboxylesterase
MPNSLVAYGQTTLPDGVRSVFVDNHNGVRMHALEAGFAPAGQPLLLLLHGFPELAYSWRKVMLPLAEAGFHVVAPDQRGYGRSGGTDVGFDDDLHPFSLLQHVTDALGLVRALGHREVAGVVGHDYGSPVAAWCALARPDVFRSVVMLSAPFDGAPAQPFEAGAPSSTPSSHADIHAELAALDPPRKHYHWYYSTRKANSDLCHPPQGVHDFLRAYYHMKSADWTRNDPSPLASWTGAELARLPRYYVMDRDQTMPASVAPEMPSPSEIAACTWLSDEELRVYSGEYTRNGFQGGLQSYRVGTDRRYLAELRVFSGRTIDVPACFIAGTSDWGTYQRPGRFEAMQTQACTVWRGAHLRAGAGHWAQQEQPAAVVDVVLDFLRGQGRRISTRS